MWATLNVRQAVNSQHQTDREQVGGFMRSDMLHNELKLELRRFGYDRDAHAEGRLRSPRASEGAAAAPVEVAPRSPTDRRHARIPSLTDPRCTQVANGAQHTAPKQHENQRMHHPAGMCMHID